MARVIQCFWMEGTGWWQRYLRRYVGSDKGEKCPGPMSYHDYMVPLDRVQQERDADGILRKTGEEMGPVPERTAPPWPTACGCGFLFRETDAWQVFVDEIYRRVDTGQEFPLRQAPEGALWDAKWARDFWKGPDGRSLIVRLPGAHDWQVDGPCTNCPWSDGSHPEHKCWVRHGEPPNITVDKAGNTCPVGGGSISIPGFHAMMVAGQLREC